MNWQETEREEAPMRDMARCDPEAFVKVMKAIHRNGCPEATMTGVGIANAMHNLGSKYGAHAEAHWHRIAQLLQALFFWIDDEVCRENEAMREKR